MARYWVFLQKRGKEWWHGIRVAGIGGFTVNIYIIYIYNEGVPIHSRSPKRLLQLYCDVL